MLCYVLRWFLRPLKNLMICFLEGNAALPVGCDSMLRIVMAVAHILKRNCWVGCDSP
jgi:hypothetical protein